MKDKLPTLCSVTWTHKSA